MRVRTGLWLSLGGFQECGPDAEHIYNSHVILNSAGDISARCFLSSGLRGRSDYPYLRT